MRRLFLALALTAALGGGAEARQRVAEAGLRGPLAPAAEPPAGRTPDAAGLRPGAPRPRADAADDVPGLAPALPALASPVQDAPRDAGACRVTCAETYYFCLSGEAGGDCASDWAACRSGCQSGWKSPGA